MILASINRFGGFCGSYLGGKDDVGVCTAREFYSVQERAKTYLTVAAGEPPPVKEAKRECAGMPVGGRRTVGGRPPLPCLMGTMAANM